MPSLQALIFGRKRSIETKTLDGALSGEAIIPDVIISEMHTDEVVVTQHPVDVGAQVTDHAYRQPATVICTFGWSESSRTINSLFDGSFFRGAQTIDDIYKLLLKLKDERQPLKLSTGKRTYDTVIITKIQTSTTADTETSAIIEVTFQELILARSKTVYLASIQKDPSKTGGESDRGDQYADTVRQMTNSVR